MQQIDAADDERESWQRRGSYDRPGRPGLAWPGPAAWLRRGYELDREDGTVAVLSRCDDWLARSTGRAPADSKATARRRHARQQAAPVV